MKLNYVRWPRKRVVTKNIGCWKREFKHKRKRSNIGTDEEIGRWDWWVGWDLGTDKESHHQIEKETEYSQFCFL